MEQSKNVVMVDGAEEYRATYGFGLPKGTTFRVMGVVRASSRTQYNECPYCIEVLKEAQYGVAKVLVQVNKQDHGPTQYHAVAVVRGTSQVIVGRQ